MIKASLSPLTSCSGEAIEEGRHIVSKARSMAAQGAARSRARAQRYARYIRGRGFRQGYLEGIRRAEQDMERVVSGVRAHYAALGELARKDAQELALRVCEEVIDSSLSQCPALIVPWFERALELMKRSRKLVIEYHPRYAEAFRNLSPALDAHVEMREGVVGQQQDFSLHGELGGIDFCWRDVMGQALTSPSERSCP